MSLNNKISWKRHKLFEKIPHVYIQGFEGMWIIVQLQKQFSKSLVTCIYFYYSQANRYWSNCGMKKTRYQNKCSRCSLYELCVCVRAYLTLWNNGVKAGKMITFVAAADTLGGEYIIRIVGGRIP